jgi:hypothetical protein
MNENDIQKAWSLLSQHNSELMLENARLNKQLEECILRRSLWHRIKRAFKSLMGKA